MRSRRTSRCPSSPACSCPTAPCWRALTHSFSHLHRAGGGRGGAGGRRRRHGGDAGPRRRARQAGAGGQLRHAGQGVGRAGGGHAGPDLHQPGPSPQHDRHHDLGHAHPGDRVAHPEAAVLLHQAGERGDRCARGSGRARCGCGSSPACAPAGCRSRISPATWRGRRSLHLFSGHVDAWHSRRDGQRHGQRHHAGGRPAPGRAGGGLRRGLRLAFWSGHSHGRYAGSAWYADHAWRELHRHGVLHLNVDSTGARGATDYRLPRHRGRAELRRGGGGRRDGPARPGAAFLPRRRPVLLGDRAARRLHVAVPAPASRTPSFGWAMRAALRHRRLPVVVAHPRGHHRQDRRRRPGARHQVYVASALRLFNAPVLPLGPAARARAVADDRGGAARRRGAGPGAGLVEAARGLAERADAARPGLDAPRRRGRARRAARRQPAPHAPVPGPGAAVLHRRRPLHPRPGRRRCRRWRACSAPGSCPAWTPPPTVTSSRSPRSGASATVRITPSTSASELAAELRRPRPTRRDSMTRFRNALLVLLAVAARRGAPGPRRARPRPRSGAAPSPSCGPPIPCRSIPTPRDHRARRVGVLQHARVAARRSTRRCRSSPRWRRPTR